MVSGEQLKIWGALYGKRKNFCMKAVCISIFNHYENRIVFVEEFLKSKGFDVIYIASDFNHYTKQKYRIDRENAVQVSARPYNKNISPARLFSHAMTSRALYRKLKEIKPDLIYTLVPPNTTAQATAKYKRRYGCKLIFDLYDLWPETFPSLSSKKLLTWFFRFWQALRDNQLSTADYIVAECELYRRKMKRQLAGLPVKTLRLAKNASEVTVADTVFDEETINICYLGSINNVIDMKAICALLCALIKLRPAVVHIIGEGENRCEFISMLEGCGIPVKFYGPQYSEELKRSVFSFCCFGLNMIKDSTCIGVTMKSVDYFEAGLPLLNNVGADTAEIIEKYGAGVNIGEDKDAAAAEIAAMTKSEMLAMRGRCRNAFYENFSAEIFNRSFGEVFDALNCVKE